MELKTLRAKDLAEGMTFVHDNVSDTIDIAIEGVKKISPTVLRITWTESYDNGSVRKHSNALSHEQAFSTRAKNIVSTYMIDEVPA